MPLRVELALAVVLFAAVNVAMLAAQERVGVNGGAGWDGSHYAEMAAQVADGGVPSEAAPFVFRVAVPALVGLLAPSDPLQGFLAVNVVANLVTTILLVSVLRGFVGSWSIRLLLLSLFLVTWSSPVRMVYYEPASLDAWFVAAACANVLALRAWRSRAGWASGTLVLLGVGMATAVREAGLLFAFAPLFVLPNAQGRAAAHAANARLAAAAACVGLGVLLASHLAVRVEASGYSFVLSALHWAFTKSIVTYLLSWVTAFGPILLLPVLAWRRTLAVLRANPELAYVLSAIALLAFIGGLQTERFVYWSMPIVAILGGVALEAYAVPLVRTGAAVVAGAAQAFASRVFWTLPDYPTDHGRAMSWHWPVFNVPGHLVRLRELTPSSASRTTQVIIALEYVWLFALLAASCGWTAKRPPAEGPI